MPIFVEFGNVRLFPMSILLGFVNSHVWVLYNIPELGNHFKNGILLGNVETIYSNSHFSKLGITMGFPIKTQSNLKWEFRNNPNFYLVLNYLYWVLNFWIFSIIPMKEALGFIKEDFLRTGTNNSYMYYYYYCKPSSDKKDFPY